MLRTLRCGILIKPTRSIIVNPFTQQINNNRKLIVNNNRYFHTTNFLLNENNDQPTNPPSTENPPVIIEQAENIIQTEQAAEQVSQQPAEGKKKKKEKKERKKKKKDDDIPDEDPAARKKRINKARQKKFVYTADMLTNVDPDAEDLNDDFIRDKISKLLSFYSNAHELRREKKRYIKEGKPLFELSLSYRFWDGYEDVNPYFRIRYQQVLSQFLGRDLRKLSNEEYIAKKFNTLARMFATHRFHNIFPSVLPKFTPTLNLIIEYNHPIARDVLVYYGQYLPACITEKPPRVQFTGKPNSFYTLLLVDAKNLEELEFSDYNLHWAVGNIPSNGDVSQGTTLAEYLGGLPRTVQHPHRLVYLLFRQLRGKMAFENENTITSKQLFERDSFNVNQFAFKHDLKPRGLAYHLCGYDHSVRERLAALGYDEPIIIKQNRLQRAILRYNKKGSTRARANQQFTWPVTAFDFENGEDEVDQGEVEQKE